MRYATYPSYKSSGAEWLGSVPKHWEVKRLKFLLRKMDQGYCPVSENSPAEDGEWGVLKVSAVSGPEFDPRENKRLPNAEQPLREFEIRSGDFLLSRANTRELLGSAALVPLVPPRLLLCDKLYRLQLRTGELDERFLLFFMRSVPGHFEFEREATGASGSMQNISQDVVRNLWLLLPPLLEQRAIANFLDAQTAKLDALVAKKQALIEKLKEKCSALISQTVTRGLPPAAARAAGLRTQPELKVSGVEWLGVVPEHWDFHQLKWAITFQRGHDLPADEREEGHFPFVTSSGVSATHSRAVA